MKKTSIYLAPEDVERLRRLSAQMGKPGAEIVREAVAEYDAKHGKPRVFRSEGAGESGDGDPSVADLDLDALLGELLGEDARRERT